MIHPVVEDFLIKAVGTDAPAMFEKRSKGRDDISLFLLKNSATDLKFPAAPLGIFGFRQICFLGNPNSKLTLDFGEKHLFSEPNCPVNSCNYPTCPQFRACCLRVTS